MGTVDASLSGRAAFVEGGQARHHATFHQGFEEMPGGPIEPDHYGSVSPGHPI